MITQIEKRKLKRTFESINKTTKLKLVAIFF